MTGPGPGDRPTGTASPRTAPADEPGPIPGGPGHPDAARTTTPAPAPHGSGFAARLTAPLLLGSVLNPLNTTMISTALVAIGHDLGIGAADTAWLISVLYLASAVAQPVLGKLADVIGPRRVFLAGLLVVVASGLVGTFGAGFGWLLVSRLLLGIGTSAAYPAAMAVLRDESRRVGRPTPRPVLARLSFAGLGSTAVGPTLGGVLVGAFGWRAIFLVNVPMALAAFVLALVWVPADRPRTDRADAGAKPRALGIDPLGIGLFAAALTLLCVFLLDLAHPDWWLLAPFAVCAALLAYWQLRTPRPFLDLRMIARNGPLARTYLRHGLSYLQIYCVMYGFTEWLEEAHGYSSTQSGLVMLPMSLCALVCSLTAARTKGIRAPLSLGAALLTLGAGVLAGVSGHTPLAVLLLVAACFGIPQGLLGTSNQAAIQQHAPADSIGSAAGLQRTAQYIGAITASSLIALAYGQRASDSGMHLMALVSAVLGAAVLVLTLLDRSLRPRA
ncbi:MFS transporter [Streptomyces sp. SID11385]|uniref:MFS transporter n=1 Tax=Streptomyces sp. SID11385 TaxID=2706031 RepID=UPI0031BB09E7